MKYKERLYNTYLSNHFSEIRSVSLSDLKRSQYIFKIYYKRFLPELKTARILDVGCGYGPLLYFLREESYEDVLGVDISSEQIEAANQLGIENVECVEIVEFLAATENEYDCIFALDVVEHFPKAEVFLLLELICKALKPTGRLILHSPNATSPNSNSVLWADFTHEIAFTKSSVSQVLKTVGFERVQVFPAGPIVHGLPSLVRWLLWQSIAFLLWIYHIVETGQLEKQVFTQNLIAVADKPVEGR